MVVITKTMNRPEASLQIYEIKANQKTEQYVGHDS